MQTIIVYDVVSREMLKLTDINSQQTSINVASLQNGMYFLKVVAEDGGQQVKKFVKY
jgi:archaellum component FlaC